MTKPGKDREAPGLEATEYFHTDKLTYTYGGHLVHLTVDPETGMVEILRYLVLEDVGRAVNPLLVHGQALGAAAQGIGGTMLEELVYNEDGQLLTTTLLDYPLPSSMEIPPVESIITEYSPSPLEPPRRQGRRRRRHRRLRRRPRQRRFPRPVLPGHPDQGPAADPGPVAEAGEGGGRRRRVAGPP